MKKKHRARVPDFTRPQRPGLPDSTQPKRLAPSPAPRVKPQATSAKSGRRGQ